MQLIRLIIKCLLLLTLLSHILSCGKKEQGTSGTITYIDRVAQDSSYRKGKWYSVSNGAGYNFTNSPLLDTIWFISDSLAGWTQLGGNPYKFLPTYFSGTGNIVYIIPNPIHVTQIDTVLHQCGMLGDTFIVYWPTSGFQVFPEHYLKMNN